MSCQSRSVSNSTGGRSSSASTQNSFHLERESKEVSKQKEAARSEVPDLKGGGVQGSGSRTGEGGHTKPCTLRSPGVALAPPAQHLLGRGARVEGLDQPLGDELLQLHAKVRIHEALGHRAGLAVLLVLDILAVLACGGFQGGQEGSVKWGQ